MPEINRRQFVTLTAASLACAACGVAPSWSLAAAGPVDVGTTADYAKDGISDKWLASHQLFVVREGDRIYAVSATCTHKSKVTKLKDGIIVCPAHGSRFAPDGKPQKGPAKSPLVRFGISVNDGGRITVDPSKRFDEKKWDEAGAFVSAS